MIIVAGGVGYWFVENGNTAYISITVYSTHTTETISVTVFLEGTHLFSEYLRPNEYVEMIEYYAYSFSMFDNDKIITAWAWSTGGKLGPKYDSVTFAVSDGGYYDFKLYV
jgi:hypothetical protein